MIQEVRWHYRFRNFSRAYALLGEVPDISDATLEQFCAVFSACQELSAVTLYSSQAAGFSRIDGGC